MNTRSSLNLAAVKTYERRQEAEAIMWDTIQNGDADAVQAMFDGILDYAMQRNAERLSWEREQQLARSRLHYAKRYSDLLRKVYPRAYQALAEVNGLDYSGTLFGEAANAEDT